MGCCEGFDEEIKELKALVKRSHEDLKSLRLSGDAGFYDECELEKDLREYLDVHEPTIIGKDHS